MSETSHPVPLIFYLIAALAILYFLFNLRRITAVRIGKKEDQSLKIFPQIFNSLFFGVGQRKVWSVQFIYASIMHFFIAWGFIELFFATIVDMFTKWGFFVETLPGKDTPWFALINDVGGVMFIIGILMALFRRYVNKPEPLPQDAFSGRGNLLGDSGILLFLLIISVGGFFSEAARLAIDQPETAHCSWIGLPLSKIATAHTWEILKPWLWWSHALLSLLFISILPYTKMFHAIVVILNVALTNRKTRGNLTPMYVSKLMEDPDADIDEISLGASKVEEFTWKQLLDSVSCTECARCTSVCPAYNTDKLLSPMKIITDIRQNLYTTRFSKDKPDPLVGGTISEEELWSCSTCGACMEQCPVLINHIPTFTDMRRFLVLSEGKPPTQASKSLENTLQFGNPWGLSSSDRTKWAEKAGIELPLMVNKKEADILYWVGCAGAYDSRNQNVSKAMIKIFEAAGVDYAVLGNEESCTGDSARRMGEEYLFETMATQNIETLNQYKFNTIVTACPHCFHTLGGEYSAFGGNYSVVHHSEFIQDLIQQGKLKVNPSVSENITYHDACYLGRHNGIYDSPRNVIQSVMKNGKLLEMKQNKKNSFCCGAGGGNMWYDIERGDRINIIRFREAFETGAKTIATACSFCLFMMDDAVKVEEKEDTVQIQDIAEIVANNIN